MHKNHILQISDHGRYDYYTDKNNAIKKTSENKALLTPAFGLIFETKPLHKSEKKSELKWLINIDNFFQIRENRSSFSGDDWFLDLILDAVCLCITDNE